MISTLTRLWQKVVFRCAIAMMRSFHRRQPEMVVISGDYVSLKVMLQGRFEHEELAVLEREVFPGLGTRRCCLDIGANIGNHSVAFSRHFDEVIAFEPNPRVFDVLCLNARWNPRITPVKMAASSRSEVIEALVPRGNLGAAKIVDSTASNGGDLVRFECARVDQYLAPERFPDVGFIKIDVEGHEYEALVGCEAILRHAHPVVAFELLEEDHDRNAARIEQFLRSVGYGRYLEITASGARPIGKFCRKNYKMIVAMA